MKSLNHLVISVVTAFAVFFGAGCRSGTTAPVHDSDTTEFDASLPADAAVEDAGPSYLCPDDPSHVFNNAFSPYRGGDSAVDLEVVDYSWFRCPHCAEFAVLFEQILADRPDIRARVRLYFHHYPGIMQSSWDMHAAAVAAGKQGMDRFWELHDYIYESNYYDDHIVTLDEIRAYCEDVMQLDMAQFDADFADPQTEAYIGWDVAQGEDAGVATTPAVFVCGERIGWGNIEEEIDKYLNP